MCFIILVWLLHFSLSFCSYKGKRAHVLTDEKVREVQYNAIRESTLPPYVPRSSARRNDLGLKPSAYL